MIVRLLKIELTMINSNSTDRYISAIPRAFHQHGTAGKTKKVNYHGKMEIITHIKHSYRKSQNLFTVFPLINAPDAYLVSEP